MNLLQGFMIVAAGKPALQRAQHRFVRLPVPLVPDELFMHIPQRLTLPEDLGGAHVGQNLWKGSDRSERYAHSERRVVEVGLKRQEHLRLDSHDDR